MKMIEKPNENYSELIRILNDLKEKGNFIGFLLVNRNGEIISENLDIITANFAGDTVSVLLGDGASNFQEFVDSPFYIQGGNPL